MLKSDLWISEHEKGQMLITAWQRLVDLMAELCKTPAGFIVQASNDRYRVIIANQSEENPYDAGVTIEPDVNIFCREVVKQNTELYVGNATERPNWLTNPEVTEDGFNTYLGYPLHWPDGSIFGTICVMDFAKTDYDERYQKLMAHFREMAERELELLNKNIQLENYARNDDLTELFNRKGFYYAAEQLLKSAKRNKATVCICFFDIDGLKEINDNFGHKAGDKIIHRFGQHLEHAFREVDVLARFGGDEFVVLLQDQKQPDTERIIERLSNLVDESNQQAPYISFSYGFACVKAADFDVFQLEQLIQTADKAMYKNKNAKKVNQS